MLYVKASGSRLAEVTEDSFVSLDMAKLLEMTDKAYPGGDAEREAAFLADMTTAKLPGQEDRRPSVETFSTRFFRSAMCSTCTRPW